MDKLLWPSNKWYEERGYEATGDMGGRWMYKTLPNEFEVLVSQGDAGSSRLPTSRRDVRIALYYQDDFLHSLTFDGGNRDAITVFGDLIDSMEQSLIGLKGNDRNAKLRDSIFAIETNMDILKRHSTRNSEAGTQSLEAILRSLETMKELLKNR